MLRHSPTVVTSVQWSLTPQCGGCVACVLQWRSANDSLRRDRYRGGTRRRTGAAEYAARAMITLRTLRVLGIAALAGCGAGGAPATAPVAAAPRPPAAAPRPAPTPPTLRLPAVARPLGNT